MKLLSKRPHSFIAEESREEGSSPSSSPGLAPAKALPGSCSPHMLVVCHELCLPDHPWLEPWLPSAWKTAFPGKGGPGGAQTRAQAPGDIISGQGSLSFLPEPLLLSAFHPSTRASTPQAWRKVNPFNESNNFGHKKFSPLSFVIRAGRVSKMICFPEGNNN